MTLTLSLVAAILLKLLANCDRLGDEVGRGRQCVPINAIFDEEPCANCCKNKRDGGPYRGGRYDWWSTSCWCEN